MDAKSYMLSLGEKAKRANLQMCFANTNQKNLALEKLAERLNLSAEEIISANKIDLDNAVANGKSSAFIDRLTFNVQRISAMAEGVLQVAGLNDPIGEVIGGGELKNGLRIVKKREPLGVIGIIFESRPNVTVDAAALCLKSGNVTILRGGSDAINTNICLAGIIRSALDEAGLPIDAVQLVEDTSREVATEMMRLSGYIDVLIPRGGAGLIRSIVANASVPVIQTGEGNCHVYVDEFADLKIALEIVDNAKTQRPSVCNAIEGLLVHKAVAAEFLPLLKNRWGDKVEILGDSQTAEIIEVGRIATDEDYSTEFNDMIISVKIVEDVQQAATHINTYGTKHSECIITEQLRNAEYFQRAVDAAAVYVNASTRFTDGFEFGLGAEIGISNQKLHARGPMGLTELTTYKYIVNGDGQIRN